MKRITWNILLIGSLLFSFGSCTPTNKVENKTTCTTEGTIVKLRLGGCKWLIQLADDTRLHPVKYAIKKPFEFEDGQKIRFSYEKVDAMTNCMAGQTVSITCMELLAASNE